MLEFVFGVAVDNAHAFPADAPQADPVRVPLTQLHVGVGVVLGVGVGVATTLHA